MKWVSEIEEMSIFFIEEISCSVFLVETPLAFQSRISTVSFIFFDFTELKVTLALVPGIEYTYV